MEIAGDIALSRVIALKDQMDVVANNIANMNTTGYKAVEMRLKEQKVEGTAPGLRPGIGHSYSMVAQMGTLRDMRQGTITATGNPLDVAIQGKGYFSVQTPDGQTRYTRNGVFQMNQEGTLVDLSGNAVLSDSGQITIPKGTTSISIGSDGTVSTNKGNLGRIGLVDFENEQALQLDGSNTLKAPEGVEAQPIEHPKMLQGAIESSNVNSVQAMTDMINVERQYQSAANIIQEEQDRTTNAIKTIARIN